MKEKAQEIRRLLRLKTLDKIVCFLVFILFSCNPSHKERVEKYLTGGGTKYWVYIPEYPQVRRHGIAYHINGTYTSYVNSWEDPRKRIAESLVYSATWKLLNDSIIDDGQGIKLRIDYINEDVLILSNISFKGTYLYFKSKDQETVPIKDTTNYQNKI